MFGFFLRSLSWVQLAIIESSCLWSKFGKSLDTYTKLKIFTSGHLMNTLLICLFVCFFSQQHLMKPNYDVVKRWVNEAQEAVSSDNTMVQVNSICTAVHSFSVCKH